MSEFLTSEVRTSTGRFAVVPYWIITHPDLSPGAKVLYSALAAYADMDERQCWVSVDRLAEELGSHVQTVRGWRRNLAEAGLLRIERRWKNGHEVSPLLTLAQFPGQFDRQMSETAQSDERNDSRQMSDSARVSCAESRNKTNQGNRPEEQTKESYTSSSTSSKPDPASIEGVKEVVDYWRLALHPRAKWSDKRARKVAARLKEGYTVDELKQAIDGAVANAHVSDKGERYDDLELICRDATKVDLFMSRAALPEKELTGTALLKSIAAGNDRPAVEAAAEVVGADIDEFLALNPPAPQADLDGIPEVSDGSH